MNKCFNEIDVGSRVWAAWGLREHGRDKVNVPNKTYGTVIRIWKEYPSMDGNELYTIKWDTGQTSVHYGNTLPICIANFKTEAEFENMVIAEASCYELIGGKFQGKVFLRSGNWVEKMWGLEARLKEANIPIK